MIKVRDRQYDAHLFAQVEQQSQQCDRVGAPGHGHGDAISRVQQFVFPDEADNALVRFVHATILTRNVRIL